MTGGHSAESQPAGLAARLAAVLIPAVAQRLADASPDGLALADADGALILVNRRVEEMFRYDRAELLGSQLDRLITASPRAGAGSPEGRMRQTGLREDGTTFPAEISLSLLATEAGEVTVAVFRDVTETWRRGDVALVTGAADQECTALEFLESVVSRLFEVGLALQAAAELPAYLARQPILNAAARLDETIGEIRRFVFAVRT